MTYTKFGTLVASVGVIAFALASHEASARPVVRGGAATAHPLAHPFTSHAFRNRRGGIFLPGVSGDFYGSDGAPMAGVTPPPLPTSSDVHYTYTYEVPWDWAHRNPPNVAPSDRPYVPSCTSEPVTVPGAKGGEHLINVTRCY